MNSHTIGVVPRISSAGRYGPDVRSDLHVTIERTDDGVIDIAVRSKVSTLYGEAIRDSITASLQAAGVWSARVHVEDEGALPFVIEARTECALRRLGSVGGDLRPKRMVAVPGSSAPDRLRRSRLYLPGNEPKFMINSGLHVPDAVILDLEDSVHPADKDAARLLARNALRSVDFGGAERMVRINPLPLGLADLEVIIPESPDLILVPKAENPDDIRKVAQTIHTLNPGRTIHLMPIVESALGVERAFEIAQAHASVVALTIGLEDYTADLGVVKTRGGLESIYARMRVVNAARAVGVQAIDSVFGDVADMRGLRSWARRSRSIGFDGMGCIHPTQIRVIHEMFAPSAAEIEKALAVVAAFEDASRKGLAVVSLGSRMIDPPVLKRAQRLVANARRQGLLKETV
ncbi:MAG TPA: aldolase/citrate lyase family protein [Longimicrobiales bacterium]